MPRIRPARKPSDHARRGRTVRRAPREQPPREPAVSGASHGEDAGPQAEGAPPREDRAG